MSTSINALAAVDPNAANTTKTAAPKDALTDKTTFLKLLVSQLKNQDPLNPVDGTQFLGQLTSYSQLEQLIGIHQDTTALGQAATATDPSATPSGSTTA